MVGFPLSTASLGTVRSRPDTGARRVKRGTGVTFTYACDHGDPYVFPTGVVEEQDLTVELFEDPVVR